MRSFTVQIPKPCHERWDAMQPAEQGRFCERCHKTVVDYSTLSDRELVRLLSKTTGEACGRFRNEQLDRPLVASNAGATWRHWLGVLTVSVFGWQTARAQLSQTGNSPQPNSVKLPSTRPTFAVNTIPIQKTIDPNAKRIVSGRVMLMDSSEHLSPVTSATVTVYQTGGNWQTQTDSAGIFTIAIPVQTTAIVNNPVQSNLSKVSVHVALTDHIRGNSSREVTLSTAPIVLGDIILYQQRAIRDITGGGMAIIRRPSLWQKFKRKLFH